jgi:signal transduction histidine kinase
VALDGSVQPRPLGVAGRVAAASHGVGRLDVLLAAVATALSQVSIWVLGAVPGPRALMSVVLLVATVPLAWRRRAPLTVVALAMSAMTFQAVYSGQAAEDPGGWAPFLVPLYSVAAHAPLRKALIGGALATVAGIVHGFFDPSFGTQADIWANAFFWLISIAAWLAGLTVHRHRDATRLAVAVARAEAEREAEAAAAVTAERTRIAQELHDIVSHTLSVMIVQADAGELVAASDPDRARVAFDTIGATGRQALDDMRRLLAILRADEDTAAALGPPAGLRDLPALTATVRASGVDASLRVDPPDVRLPEALDASVFRIVQESLTNCLKHAHARRAEVDVTVAADRVTVSVSDDGTGGPVLRPGGHGLVNIRERVAAFGGSVEIGPLPGGGFRVRAELPLGVPA